MAPWLPTAGALLGLYLYYPLYKRTMSAGVTVNIATFVLWALLDSIAAGSTFLENASGNWQLPLAHAVGSGCVAYAAYSAGVWKLTLREKLAAFFVGLSILVWLSVSNESAIIVSATGAVIAGIPLLLDWWDDPESMPIDIGVGMLLANGLGLATLAQGATFNYEQHFYAAAGVLLSTCYLAAGMSKRFRKRRATI